MINAKINVIYTQWRLVLWSTGTRAPPIFFKIMKYCSTTIIVLRNIYERDYYL
jgi:hypothetical protein